MTDTSKAPTSSAATARRDVVFVHISKTGGTSLRSALEQTFSDHLILRDYGHDSASSPELYRLIYTDRRLSEFRTGFNDRRRGILLTGHFPGFDGTRGASRYWGFFNAESFVTFLRHPIDRIYSRFAHAVNVQGWTAGLEEFVTGNEGRQRCRATSMSLAGIDLESFGFIGFTEEFQECFTALGRYLGVDLPWKKTNVGNYDAIEPDVLQSDRYRAMLQDLCREDIALYERLRRERSGRYVAPGADAQVAGRYLGRVAATEHRLTGWLCNTAREFIATVDILSKNQVIASIRADRYRERPKKLGHSRSGVCGFEIDLRSLPAASTDTRLTVRARGSDYELAGSPILP